MNTQTNFNKTNSVIPPQITKHYEKITEINTQRNPELTGKIRRNADLDKRIYNMYIYEYCWNIRTVWESDCWNLDWYFKKSAEELSCWKIQEFIVGEEGGLDFGVWGWYLGEITMGPPLSFWNSVFCDRVAESNWGKSDGDYTLEPIRMWGPLRVVCLPMDGQGSGAMEQSRWPARPY